MTDRKWLPNLAELIDRLSIHQLKEVFLSEHKEKYRKEMSDIMHDINSLIKSENVQITGELVRAIIILAQINEHIWYNEAKARLGLDNDPNLLKLTHSLNGIRNKAMNFILDSIGNAGRKDYKVDCLAAEFSQWDIDFQWSKRDEHN